MAEQNKRQGRLLTAGDVLQSLLQNSRNDLSRQFVRWRLWHFWGDVVGDDISGHTAPVGYHRGRLYVWVDNSVRLQELVFVRKSIISKINKSLGQNWVRSIQFTLDRKGVPEHAEVNQGSRDFLAKSSPSEGGDPQLDR